MRRVLFAILLALIFFTPARAQDPPDRDQNVALFGLPSRQHLFGDRGGERTALAEKGIICDFFYITDLEANPAGRLRQAQTGWERIRGTVDNNFGRLISWQGLRADAGSNRKLDLTVGFDYSPGDVSRENVQVTAGGCNAPFASRKNDRVGFAVVYSKISDSFSNFRTLLGAPPLGTEKAIELNYSLQVTPYWCVQPVFQCYVDVGARGARACFRIPHESQLLKCWGRHESQNR